MAQSFDVIVVGAGSAGAVVASRLSEGGASVLLLEAGGESDSASVRIPAFIDALLDSPLDWGYRTLPQAELMGRRIFLSRGKCLGGTSAINAMVYMRGNRGDYDHWRALGNRGWGYDEVLPFFRKSEGNRQFDDAYHGRQGPLSVSSYPPGSVIHQAFLEGAQAWGLRYNPDVNGAVQEGCGPFQATIGPEGRASTAVAFLGPKVRARANLTIHTHALATGLRFEGARVVGVDYLHMGRPAQALGGEVILCGGAINSPQLMMLSGLGPAADLAALGIAPRQDLPGVGQNLQDHLQIISRFAVGQPVTAFGLDEAQAQAAARRSLDEGAGPFHTNFCEAGAFLRCDPAAEFPDVQIHCESNFGPHYFDGTAADRHGFGLILNVCRPASRGEVRLFSADPLDRPLIDPRYLSAPQDMELTVKGVRACLQIAATLPMQAIGTSQIDPAGSDDATIRAFIRRHATTIWHPVGTARMGQDAMSVVDDRLRVHGVAGLRVADASIMPSMVSGNTNAACIMIGEKAADLFLSGAT